MPTPDLDVANLLATAGFGTVGTTIFRGQVRPPKAPIPHAALFVLASGGSNPEPYFSVSGSSASFYRCNVQVRVRGEVEGFGAAQTKAVAVRTALHLATLAGYVRCAVNQSLPYYLGMDDTEHPEFSVNATLWFKQ